MLKVDGKLLPSPTDYGLDIEEISKAERNANGLMIKEIIAFKDKLNLTWAILTREEIAVLESIKRKNFFTVEFSSMNGNGKAKGTFYAGSLSSQAVGMKNGRIEHWKGVKMNFIER